MKRIKQINVKSLFSPWFWGESSIWLTDGKTERPEGASKFSLRVHARRKSACTCSYCCHWSCIVCVLPCLQFAQGSPSTWSKAVPPLRTMSTQKLWPSGYLCCFVHSFRSMSFVCFSPPPLRTHRVTEHFQPVVFPLCERTETVLHNIDMQMPPGAHFQCFSTLTWQILLHFKISCCLSYGAKILSRTTANMHETKILFSFTAEACLRQKFERFSPDLEGETYALKSWHWLMWTLLSWHWTSVTICSVCSPHPHMVHSSTLCPVSCDDPLGSSREHKLVALQGSFFSEPLVHPHWIENRIHIKKVGTRYEFARKHCIQTERRSWEPGQNQMSRKVRSVSSYINLSARWNENLTELWNTEIREKSGQTHQGYHEPTSVKCAQVSHTISVRKISQSSQVQVKPTDIQTSGSPNVAQESPHPNKSRLCSVSTSDSLKVKWRRSLTDAQWNASVVQKLWEINFRLPKFLLEAKNWESSRHVCLGSFSFWRSLSPWVRLSHSSLQTKGSLPSEIRRGVFSRKLNNAKIKTIQYLLDFATFLQACSLFLYEDTFSCSNSWTKSVNSSPARCLSCAAWHSKDQSIVLDRDPCMVLTANLLLAEGVKPDVERWTFSRKEVSLSLPPSCSSQFRTDISQTRRRPNNCGYQSWSFSPLRCQHKFILTFLPSS